MFLEGSIDVDRFQLELKEDFLFTYMTYMVKLRLLIHYLRYTPTMIVLPNGMSENRTNTLNHANFNVRSDLIGVAIVILMR